MNKVICIFLILSLVACNSSNTTIPADLDGYEIVSIPTVDNAAIATAINGEKVTETGTIRNGVKEGTWITFHPGKTFPSIIANYMGGVLNGAYMTYSQHGQLTLVATCINGEFDGYYTQYENNKLKKEQYFVAGQLDGEVKDYFPRSDKLRSVMNYKMGVLEGKATYYTEDGGISQEYEYKNGQQQ